MSEYTPTTDEMRAFYTAERLDGPHLEGFPPPTVDQAEAEFNAWLSAHDAEVRASVVVEEPEWEYGWRSRFATGGPVFQELEWGSREQAEQSIRDHEQWEADDPEESRLVYELVKRTPAVWAGEWVPVKQEGADRADPR